MADVTKDAGEEETTGGKVRRRSVSRRTASAVDQWLRASAHAAALRGKLGLDAVSAGRLSRDLSQSRWYQAVSPLDEALAGIETRRALTGGSAGD